MNQTSSLTSISSKWCLDETLAIKTLSRQCNQKTEYSGLHSDQIKLKILNEKILKQTKNMRTSLVVQLVRIHLAMQGTPVRPLVWEDPTGPEQLNPCATTTEAVLKSLASCSHWTHVLQLLRPAYLEPRLHNKRSYCSEKAAHWDKKAAPISTTRESPCAAVNTKHSQK